MRGARGWKGGVGGGGWGKGAEALHLRLTNALRLAGSCACPSMQLGLGARAYVEGLEDVMVAALGRYGIAARVGGWCGRGGGPQACA